MREDPVNEPKPPANDAESLEEIEDDALDENPDVDTRRESFELDLMEQQRSKEGAAADLAKEEKRRRSEGTGKP
jgi:hypothetical protein